MRTAVIISETGEQFTTDMPELHTIGFTSYFYCGTPRGKEWQLRTVAEIWYPPTITREQLEEQEKLNVLNEAWSYMAPSPSPPVHCDHEWITVEGIYKLYVDCKKCKIPKEKYEEEQRLRYAKVTY